MSAEPVILGLHRLEVGYGEALWPALDAELRRGELWALVGRNGSGKSTLLRSLLGIQSPMAGRIQRAPGIRVAYVPQRGDYDLSVPARVLDFVRGGVDRGWSFLQPGLVRRHRAAVQAALQITDTEALAHRQVANLSEGQKQRVLVAKALVSEPDLLVLDEPTSAMDVVAERGVFDLLARLRTERRMAVLMASHQLRLVPEFATHTILLDADSGLALAGEAPAVLSSEAFLARWGTALT